jgi:hypothetical protein
VGFLTIFARAKRWLNPEMAKALGTVLVVLTLCIFAAVMWGKAESSGGAKRDASWMQRFNDGLAKVYKKRAEQAVVSARAAEAERAKLQDERDQAVARAAAIAAELARLQGDPVVYPKALAREMRK